MIGLLPWDISPEYQPDGRLSSEKAAEILEDTLKKGADHFDWLLRTFDGEERWMDVSLALVRSKGRKVFHTVWRDVTERKRAEERLLISQAKLLETMDLARIVHWEVDLKTGDFIFNDAFYAFYGTSAEREGGYRMLPAEYAKRFVHPDDVPLFDRARERRMASRERNFVHDFEHRIIRRDGMVRNVLARVRADKDVAGNVITHYGANQDITERSQTAAALFESEERYRTAIENSNDGVTICQRGTVCLREPEIPRHVRLRRPRGDPRGRCLRHDPP